MPPFSHTMTTDPSPSYELTTSTRYDLQLLGLGWNTAVNDDIPSAYMLLPYHLARLREAAQQHGWTKCLAVLNEEALEAVCDTAVESAIKLYPGKPFRVRITLSHDGQLLATAFPIDPFPTTDPLKPEDGSMHLVHLDTIPTQPSIFTSTKTTHREHYDSARARANLQPLATPEGRSIDVILYTPAGHLSETSIRNLALKRNNQWWTPNARSAGCLPGIMRRVLLEQGYWTEVGEGDLHKDHLVDGEIVMTANAVEGCRLARVIIHNHPST
ncbi:hypothetical protein QCA50_002202 [Cerrena zonata]|uniref:Aminotransferase n=1 Tax=Cerrena zonata TaxID=2478898 RepID=A0AAW0GV21_9APHY